MQAVKKVVFENQVDPARDLTIEQAAARLLRLTGRQPDTTQWQDGDQVWKNESRTIKYTAKS